MHTYSLIIHGGCLSFDPADTIEQKHLQEKEKSLQRIITDGWKLLASGLPALDVVEKTVNMLEADPLFNAGIGSAIGSEGQIELDASIMDGKTLNCGAVAGLIQIPHAISVARKVMEETWHVLLTGKGANVFAKKYGFKKLPKKDFYTSYQEYQLQNFLEKPKKKSVSHGTVGAVARDIQGNIAAGTSTGGLTGKLPGRVGDTPLIGAGTYANNTIGGASATGYGEQIIKVNLTKLALDFIRFQNYSAQQACEAAIRELGRLKNGLGGIILIDAKGEISAYYNEDFLPHAYMSSTMKEPEVRVSCQ